MNYDFKGIEKFQCLFLHVFNETILKGDACLLKSKIVFGNNSGKLVKLQLGIDETNGGLYVI